MAAIAGMVLLAVIAGCGDQPATVAVPTAQRLLGAKVAFDPGTGGVVAFGGEQRTGGQLVPSGAMWRWSRDRWQPVPVTTAPSARTGTLMAADPGGHGLLLYGGSNRTSGNVLACPTPAKPGHACAFPRVAPDRFYSDTWAFTGGVWRRLAPDGEIPQGGTLMANDPALGRIVLVGASLVADTRGVSGTWTWTGRRWRPLSSSSPRTADTVGYDPLSHRLLAYGGQEPFTPAAGMGAPAAPGYSSTWTFSGTHWVELHPPTTPDRAPGVLTPSPDGQHLLLINTRGKTWTWTGQDWQYHPTDGNPCASRSPRNNTALSAATDPALGQIVLLTTGPGDNDETWTLHDDKWTRHPRTP